MKIDICKFNVHVAKSCFTMKKLSEISGVNVTTLSRINNGKQEASPITIGKIAKGLKIDVEELIENTISQE